MLPKRKILSLLLMAVWLYTGQAKATGLKPFVSGSYQEILNSAANQPLMLVIWSITCSSCLKDMALLSKLHTAKPDLRIVMLATDGVSAAPQIEAILQKNHLTAVENWNYAHDNTQKLQYEIDPNWYGELPRTYFFDKAHQKQAVSGVLKETDYQVQFDRILK